MTKNPSNLNLHSVSLGALDPQAVRLTKFLPVDCSGNKFLAETELQQSPTFEFCFLCWWAHPTTYPSPYSEEAEIQVQVCVCHRTYSSDSSNALSHLVSAAPRIPQLEQESLAMCFLGLMFCFGCIPVSCTSWECYSTDKMSSGSWNAGKKNAYTTVKVDPDVDYCTPGAFELERLLWKGCPKYTHVNEVWPNLYIGDE